MSYRYSPDDVVTAGGRTTLKPAAKKASKLKNVRVQHDGVKFASKAERNRYLVLKKREQIGTISSLRMQVPFILAPAAFVAGKPKRALRYVCDFDYIDEVTGLRVVEDVKGMLTDVYVIKRHLMKTVLGIDITEIKR